MGGSSEPKQQVVQYYMSLHFGICHGPLDFITQIQVQEKEAWAGEVSTLVTFEIDREDLFGGVKKEGGVAGSVTYLPGDADQTIPEFLAAKHGKTTATMPAYRGIATIAFTGESDSERGFYWSANSPYLPGVWVRASRASLELNEIHARIYRDTNEAFKRDIANQNIDGSAVLSDIAGGKIVHFNTAQDKIIAEDPRTGEVSWETDISYTPLWLSICEETNQVLVLNFEENTMRAYDLDDGDLQQTLSGLSTTGGFESLSGPPSNAVQISTETTTYTYIFWKVYVSLQCLVHNSLTNTWSRLWTNNLGLGILWSYGGIVAASPNGYIAHKTSGDSGSPYRITWSDLGVSDVHFASEHFATTGWDMVTEVLNQITWMEDIEAFAFVGNGQYMTLSEDLTEVIAYNGSTGYGSGSARYPSMGSRRAYMGGSTVVYVNQEHNLAGGWGTVYTINALTGEIVQSNTLAEFGFTGSIFHNSYLEIGWDGDSATMLLLNNEEAWAIVWPHGEFDSNPAHIIYESLINTSWGMGAPESSIDVGSFTDAAATLYDEEFGLSMIWTRQTTIEAFVTEILDHIEATLFVSPRTGLLTLKLIRDDYSIPSLPVFTPDNSLVTRFSRKLWGETINEISVTWTNPENEEEETVVAQDIANIATQGEIVPDGRNYYGVRVKELAMRLAQRDLRSASTPLASCDIETDRSGWDLLPGDVLVLNSPEDGIDTMVMRVGPVEYGKPGDATVKASLVEDVFALAASEYTVPPDTLSEDTSEAPSTADFTLVTTLPHYIVANKLPLTEISYPQTFAGVLAAEDGPDTFEFDLYGVITDGLGNESWELLGTKNIISRATLPEDIDAEVETILITTFPDRTRGNGPIVGGFVLIEGDDDTEHEFCIVTDSGGSPFSYTLQRGVLDTVPRAWPAGTSVWFIDSSLVFYDSTIRSDAEEVDYRVLPRTSRGTLPLADAPIITETLNGRPNLPSRPANIMVNGDPGFVGPLNLVGVDPIPTSWERRNRLTEDSLVLAWDAGDVTPETGQTTIVRLTDMAGVILHEYTGIAGTTQDVDPADFGSTQEGYIVFLSERDSLESLQGFRVHVVVAVDMFFEDGDTYEFEDGTTKEFENLDMG